METSVQKPVLSLTTGDIAVVFVALVAALYFVQFVQGVFSK